MPLCCRLLGVGEGNYSSASQLNTDNPPLRDTVTIPMGGWGVVRFKVRVCGLRGTCCFVPRAGIFPRATSDLQSLVQHGLILSASRSLPACLAHVPLQADNPGAWLFHCHITWHRYV